MKIVKAEPEESFFLLFFTLLCSGSLFLYVPIFNDTAMMSKWFGFYACIFLSGCFIFLLRYKNERFALVPFDIILLFVWICFLLFSLINEISVKSVLFYPALFVLYFSFRLFITHQRIKYVLLIVSVLCFFLSLYGIGQFPGLFPRIGNFKVSGSFDNPAGYAASLAFGFPFVFYFLSEKRKIFKYSAYFVLAIIAFAIILSGSRAGILSIICASLFFIYQRSKFHLKIKYSWLVYFAVVLISVLFLYGLYDVKKDSADGRLLIWNCTGKMIREKPLTGHGNGSFKAEYMLYQADYFRESPDSPYAPLADNVIHPFNEFLLVLVEYGIAGLFLLLIVAIAIVKLFRRNQSRSSSVLLSSLIAIFIFSCFSYPMNYPFAWIMFVLCLAALANVSDKAVEIDISPSKYKIISGAVSVLSVFCLFFLSKQTGHEYQWRRIARKSLAGHTMEMIPAYEKLFPEMKTTPLFLYNYAAELKHIGEYEKSKEIIILCEKSLNDYDVQMLAGENYLELKEYEKAEEYFGTASFMCPNRFIPLYQLSKIYKETEQSDKLKEIAREIVSKPVKIPSEKVLSIKEEMKNEM